MCLSVCNALTSESLDIASSVLVRREHLQNIYVKRVYQGHQVKVNIPGAKTVSVYPATAGLPSIERQFC